MPRKYKFKKRIGNTQPVRRRRLLFGGRRVEPERKGLSDVELQSGSVAWFDLPPVNQAGGGGAGR